MRAVWRHCHTCDGWGRTLRSVYCRTSVPLIMPAKFPAGRCGTATFCRIAGLCKTTFATRYRKDPYYMELFDIRMDGLNRLNMSLSAARRFGEQRAGQRPHGNTGRFPTHPCPHCGGKIHPRVNICPLCQKRVRPAAEDRPK